MEASITKESVCIYNSTIDCFGHAQCSTCGWNPKVKEKRVRQFLKEHAVTKHRRPHYCPIKNCSMAEQKQKLGIAIQCYSNRCEGTPDGICLIMQRALDHWQQEVDSLASGVKKKVEII